MDRLTLSSIVMSMQALAVCCALSCPTQADEDSVEAAQQAFRTTGQPWYDAQQDQVRTLTDAKQPAKPTRADWQLKKRNAWNWSWNGPGNWSWLGDLMKALAWGVLVALLGLLIYALVKTYLNANPIRAARSNSLVSEHEVLTDDERVENLPVNLAATKGDFLSMAASHYQSGNFDLAIVYLFSHRLIQLDRAGCIRLTKGKTNRQYLLELRNHADLQNLIGKTMASFEDFFFGKHSLSREQFEACWHSNDRFLQLLEQVGL